MLVEVAVEALVEGSESINLAILAGENPDSDSIHIEDLTTYFHKGLKEEGIPVPSRRESEISLFLHTLEEIKDGGIDPVDGMIFIDNELRDLVLFPDADRYVGAKLGLEHCYTWYREYQDYLDGSDIWYYTELPRDEAAIKFKEHIVEEASNALERIKRLRIHKGEFS